MKVPPEKQVLLISGGEALDPNLRVCQYSAGTDTNPIFLFSKTTIEGQDPPSPSIDYGTDTDLKVDRHQVYSDMSTDDLPVYQRLLWDF